MTQPVPAIFENALNRGVLAYLAGRSAHGDVAQVLAEAVEPFGDVQTFCPDKDRMAYIVVATRGVIFGFAAGMSLIGFRLDPEDKARALASGAADLPEPGADWASLTLFRADWPEPDLRFWARRAYVHVREVLRPEPRPGGR